MTKLNTPCLLRLGSVLAVGLSTATASAGGKDNIKLSYALGNAKVDLATAITRTETQYGGTVIKADLEREHGRYMYEIDVVKNSLVTEVMFDPKDGTLHASDTDSIDDDQSRVLAALRSAKTSLISAIAIATEHTRAKAKEVKMDEDDGNFYIEVELVADAAEYDVMIEPATGKVLWIDKDDP